MPIVSSQPKTIEIRAKCGERLLDVVDGGSKPDILFECRGATCGTCRVRILEGAHLIEPPSTLETQTLASLPGACMHDRLACQIRFKASQGALRIMTLPPSHESI